MINNSKTSANMFFAFSIFACSCNASGQGLQVEQLLKGSVSEQLKSKEIKFEQAALDAKPNYSIKLYGEKIPEKATILLTPKYNIDWEKETIEPVLFYQSIPLRNPDLLTDKSGTLLILVAEVGNDGPQGAAKAGVFSDDDVITLEKKLTATFGKGKMVRKNSYEGNVYIWKKNGIIVRLTIENEGLEKKSSETRNGVEQNGRHGVLTIYNNVTPGFHTESADYFNDPDIRNN